MKSKRTFLLVIPVLMLGLLGCHKKTETAFHVYEYPGMNDDTSIFSYSGDSYKFESEEAYNNPNAAKNYNFEFMGKEYELVYEQTKGKELLPYVEDRYYDKNNPNFRVSFLENTDKVVGVINRKGIPNSSSKQPEREEDYIQIANDIVKNYIQLDDYIRTCSTSVSILQEEDGVSSGGSKTEDYFYKSNNETESIMYYKFIYTKYVNGFPTFETASVSLNPDGLLCSLQLNAIDLFDSAKEYEWNKQLLNKSVIDKLETICRSEYIIKSNENQAILCLDKENKPFFAVAASPVVQDPKGNIIPSENCIFIVTLE